MSQTSERSRQDSEIQSKSQVTHSEGNGSADRQQGLRAESSSTSSSSDGGRARQIAERTEGHKKSSHKHHHTEGGKVYTTVTSSSQGAGGAQHYAGGSGGAYGLNAGTYNTGVSTGADAFNFGGGAHNFGATSFNTGNAFNFGTGGYNTMATGASYSTGGDAYNLSTTTQVTGERRKGRFRQEKIRLPDQAQGQVRQVRKRVPTPEPDTIERTYIQRAPAEIVEEITEVPTTPPPIVKERTVVEPAGPAQVHRRTIRVPGRSAGYQQQVTGGGQFTNTQINAGVLGTSQQIGTGFQQSGAIDFSGGFAGATTGFSNFAGMGGGIQQPAFGGFGAAPNQVLPPPGCQVSYCFYV